MTILRSWPSTLSPTTISLTRFTSWSTRRISAGPEAKAEARKRGANMAVFQNGRAALAEYKNAVTVCLISLFSATLVVLIARSLDSHAASQLEPQLARIAEELQTIREQGGIAAASGEKTSAASGARA